MNPETLKKIILSALLGLGGLYVYFSMLLGPLGTREVNARKGINGLKPKIEAAQKEITRTRGKEQAYEAADTAHHLRQILDEKIPTGASIAWFPERMASFFSQHGVKGVSYQLVSEERDSSLSGFKTSRWNIMISRIPFQTFGNVLAALENQEGLAQISLLQMDADLTVVESQRVRLELATIVK